VWRTMLVWIPAMALSRMYLGRHFLGDVLGGMGVGVIAVAIGVLGLTLARLSNPRRAGDAAGRSLLLAGLCAILALVIGIPAPYDAGRFLGLAIGAAWIVVYVGPRFAGSHEIPSSVRLASLFVAALVFGFGWWGTRVILAATDIARTPFGMLLAGGLPMTFLLPVPLYLTDRFLIRQLHRAGA
jgi:PAP2 superfamily